MENEIHNKRWGASIAKYGIWYLLSSIITKGLGIILLPVYTKYLTPDDYGLLQTLNSVAAFLPFVLSLSLDSAFARYYHEVKYDKNKMALLYSTVYWFVFLYGSVILIITFLSADYWLEDFLTVSVFPYAYLVFIPVLLNQLALLGRTFLQQALETKKSTILDICSTLLNAGLSVLLLVCFNLGVMSRLLGIALGSVFLFVFYHFYFLKNGLLRFCFSKECLLKCLSYSLPMLPAMAGSWISSMSDRLVIAKYCSMASVGLYSLAFQLGQILYLVGDAITRVVGPLIMSGLISDSENTKSKIANSAYQIFVLMLFANLCLFVFADEIIKIFADEAYYGAALFIPLFGFNYVLGMQQRYPVSIISFKKKTWIISAGCILMACLNLALNLAFVPSYGYEFSVWASVAANLFYCIWSFVWGQRFEVINYKFKQSVFALIVFLIVVFASYYTLNLLAISGIKLLLIKILVITIFGLFAYNSLKK